MNDQPRSLQRQSGLASIVFVLLVGLVVAATSTSTLRSIGKSQEVNVALNATTHAQTGVWAGTEAFRRYLEAVDRDTIDALPDSLAIAMDPAYGDLVAGDISVEHTADGGVRVSADITNRHAAARSSAAHHVVFEITAGAGSGGSAAPGLALNFNYDLNTTGDFTVRSDGEPVDINVDGDVSLGGHNINPSARINATGEVDIYGTAELDSIYAGQDVDLGGTTTVLNVETLGNFTAGQGAGVENVWANGNVEIGSNGWFSMVNSVRNITVVSTGSAGHGDLLAGETLSVRYGPTTSARAVGNVSLSTPDRLDTVATMGNLTCNDPSWRKFSSLRANGSITGCASSAPGAPVTPGAGDTIVPMTPIAERVLGAPRVDVHELKGDANYVVEWDPAAGRRGLIKVTVNQIEGLSDGAQYHLGSYPATGGGSPHYNYLCTSVDRSDNCLVPAQPMMPLCLADYPNQECISYSSGIFEVRPSNLAPGVMFFDGDLNLSNGSSATTLLVSGNAVVSGTTRNWAANYGSYDLVCLGNVPDRTRMNGTARQRYSSAFSTHYPSNLCDTAAGTYNAIPTANIGLAAGGVDPDQAGGNYSGGDITIGGTTDVVGAVLAGNLLDLGGTTTIAGLVSSGAIDDIRSQNQTSGDVIIDLTVQSADYDPNALPGSGAAAQTGPDGPPLASLLWVRPY